LKKALFVILGLMLMCASAQTATYYVSPTGLSTNPGTKDRPFLKLSHACDVVSPGDEIVMRAGTYSTSGPFGCKSGASWNEPITIRPYPGETIVWTIAEGASGSYFKIGEFGSSKFLKLIGEYTPSEDGISPGTRSFILHRVGIVGTGDDLWIENVEIRKTSGDCIQGGNRMILRNNDIHHCSTSLSHHGIYSHTSDSLIEGNWFHHSGGFGIHLYNNKQNTGACVPGERHTGTVSGCGVINNVVRGNRVYDNSSGMIIFPGVDNTVVNNLFYRNRGAGIRCNSRDALIAHNTFYKNQGNTGSCAANVNLGQLVLNNGCQGGTVLNNLIWGANRAAICASPQLSAVLIDHNLTGKTSDPIDPMVVDANAGDFRLLLGSPAMDAGTPRADVTTDHIGISRPQGRAYDIGAFESRAGLPRTPTNPKLR
jgi:hypothetical protein